MKIKRLLTVMCAVLTGLSGIVVPVPAAAEEKAEPSVQTDMEITGNGSLGEMLAEKLTAEQTALNEQNECSVYDVQLSDKQAYVQYSAALDCTVLLTLFDDSGETLLTSAKADVTAEEQSVIMDIPDMPEHCYLRCCLIEPVTLAPVSAVYSSSLYTQEMQEFLNKTAADFDADRVINLDEDDTTNFAVFADHVILLQSTESLNTLLSEDAESKTYVLGNIDGAVRELKHGDVFALDNEAVGMLIVTVDTISIDDSTATVTGADMELTDVLEYMRLESNPDAMEITQEPTAPDEDTSIELISQEEAEAFFDSVTPDNQTKTQPSQPKPPQYLPEIRFVDLEGTVAGFAFKVPISTLSKDKETSQEAKKEVLKSFEPKERTDGFDPKKPRIFLDIVCKLDFDFKFYISTAHQYLKLEPTFKFGVQGGVELKGTYSKRLTEKPIGVSFFKIINLELVPRFEVEGKVKGTLEGTIKYKPLICFDSDKDQKSNFVPKPEAAFTLKVVGTVFIGVSIAPALDVVKDDKIALKLELKAGIEFKAEWSKQLLPPEDNQHDCDLCIDGEINGVCSMKTKIIVLKLPALTFEWTLADVSQHLGNYYYSIFRNQFGFGRCPYDLHKVTFVVLDEEDHPVSGAEVTSIINKQTVSSLTNEEGKAELMMNAGSHNYNITKEGYEGFNASVKVNNTSRLKYITLSKDNNTGSGSSSSVHRIPHSEQQTIKYGIQSYGLLQCGTVIVKPGEQVGIPLIMLGPDVPSGEYLDGANISLKIEIHSPLIISTVKACDSVQMNGLYIDKDNRTATMTLSGPAIKPGTTIAKIYADIPAATPSGAWPITIETQNCRKQDGTIIVQNSASTPKPENAKISVMPRFYFSESYSEKTASTYTTETNIFATAASRDESDLSALSPNSVYNIYALSDRERGVSAGNLLYFAQIVSDASGAVTVNYSGDVVAVKAKYNLANSEFELLDFTYDGTEKEAFPVVTANGKTLTEGEDYLVSGSYTGTDGGVYSILLEGTGDWFGEKLLTYTIDGKNAATLSGDVNLDGTVSIADAVLLTRLISEDSIIPNAYSWANSDINNDGLITIIDVSALLKNVAETVISE